MALLTEKDERLVEQGKINCFGCGRDELITFKGDDGEGGTYYLCDDCEEEGRIMLADFIKYEL